MSWSLTLSEEEVELAEEKLGYDLWSVADSQGDTYVIDLPKEEAFEVANVTGVEPVSP